MAVMDGEGVAVGVGVSPVKGSEYLISVVNSLSVKVFKKAIMAAFPDGLKFMRRGLPSASCNRGSKFG